MNYPLTLSFKIVALAPQIHLRDADGETVCFVRQKLFKFKEAVGVFSDVKRTNEIAQIKADRVIDFSARYNFTDMTGNEFGSIKRRGMRSLFKAHYEIEDDDVIQAEIHEENPWAKFWDSTVGELPIIGMFTGYMFHPKYLVTRSDGTELLRITKRAAFFEGKFEIEQLAEMEQTEEMRCFMAIVMMTLLERRRG